MVSGSTCGASLSDQARGLKRIADRDWAMAGGASCGWFPPYGFRLDQIVSPKSSGLGGWPAEVQTPMPSTTSRRTNIFVSRGFMPGPLSFEWTVACTGVETAGRAAADLIDMVSTAHEIFVRSPIGAAHCCNSESKGPTDVQCQSNRTDLIGPIRLRRLGINPHQDRLVNLCGPGR